MLLKEIKAEVMEDTLKPVLGNHHPWVPRAGCRGGHPVGL